MNIYRKRQIAAFTQMLLVAMMANSLAPLNKTFQVFYNLSVTQASFLPATLTLGSVVGNFSSSVLVSKLGLREFNKLAYVILMITSLLALTVSSIYTLFILLFFIGVTTATGFVASSTIISHLPSKYHNFGLYHAFFGFGAIISPAVIGVFLLQDISYEIYFSAFSVVAIILLFVFIKFPILEEDSFEKVHFSKAFEIIRNRIVQTGLIILVLYAGLEMGLIFWSGNLFVDVFHFTTEKSVFFISIFGILFTVTRVFMELIEKSLRFKRMMIIAILGSVICLVLLLITGSPFAFFFIAIGFAPIFPSVQKYVLKHIPVEQSGIFNSMMYGFAALGNILMPFFMGYLGNNNFIIAFLVPLVGLIGMFFVLMIMLRIESKGHILPS